MYLGQFGQFSRSQRHQNTSEDVIKSGSDIEITEEDSYDETANLGNYFCRTNYIYMGWGSLGSIVGGQKARGRVILVL